MRTKHIAGIFFFLVTILSAKTGITQNDSTGLQTNSTTELRAEIASLKTEIVETRRELNNLNLNFSSGMRDYSSLGLVLFLFGAFCALWAQDTGRNQWVWFFLGFFFSVLAVIAMLIRNAEDIRSEE